MDTRAVRLKRLRHVANAIPAVALLVLLASCDDSSRPSVVATSSNPFPTLTNNPNPDAPLTGILSVATAQPTRITLDVTDDVASWTLPLSTYQTAYNGPVAGFRPGTTHSVHVTVTDQAGNSATYPKGLSLTTPALPADFPPLSVVVSDPAAMEPGLTLVEPAGPGRQYLIALDAAGHVVWHYTPSTVSGRMNDARRLANGNLTFIGARDFIEMTPAGDFVTRLVANGAPGAPPSPAGAVPIAVANFHHEAAPLPSGHFVALTQEVRTYSNYPASYADLTQLSASARIVGDVIVEFKRDGSIVNIWNVLDLLDPYRIGYLSLSATTVGLAGYDWSHGNAVIYDPQSDAFIVSVRHQDVVIKFKRNLTGHGSPSDLIWMLGNPQGWGPAWQPYLLTPTNFSVWQYHQHAPMVMAGGDLLLYDNGNYKALPPSAYTPDSANYSRAVQYHIDETLKTVAQVWDFGGPGSMAQTLYTGFIGDANEMPQTGNVLIDFGGISYSGGQATHNLVARVVETTRAGRVVFQLDMGIDSPDPVVQKAVFNYRADRIPSLNP